MLKKEVFSAIKKEFQYIGILFLVVFIIFKIAFFNENLIVLFRNVLSLFWLFVLPGYFLMFYWNEKLEFMERLLIGSALSAGLIGILSYYSGLVGLNVKYHAILLPLALMIISFIAVIRKYN